MTTHSPAEPSTTLSTTARAAIDKWLQKFPADKKRSAVIQALMIVQEENQGWLSDELMNAVADYLELEPVMVYEVATFYSMFDLKPVGKNKIKVCTNISCMLCGSAKIVEHLEKRLGIKLGQTTPDNKFTLKEEECLAACTKAPMMLINQTYYENLTEQKVDEILKAFE